MRTECLACLAAVALSLTCGARAEDTYWEHDPGLPDEWSVAGNWSAGVPTDADSAWIDNGGTAHVSSGLAEADCLYVGDVHSGTYLQTGGTAEIGREWAASARSTSPGQRGPKAR